MNIGNFIAILLILVAVVGIIVYYIKALSKQPDEIEEYESVYSIKYLTDSVAQAFADTQKANLKEQNLSKQQLEAEQRKKLELKRSLKTAAFGDPSAKKFVKSFIKDIIQGRKLNVNEDTIDMIIPFNHENALDSRMKSEILFYLYLKNYGSDGFARMMSDYQLNKPKKTKNQNDMEYEVTKKDIEKAFHDAYSKVQLNYEDKLEILAQRIFEDYKGFDVVDRLFEFSVDEIDCGVSGIPKGTYDIKKEMMTDDFEYSFDSIFVVFKGINYKMSCLSFGKQENLVRVCQNIYKFAAPYALSRRKGIVVGTMKDGSRISVARPPVATSWCFFARKFDSTPSLSPEALIVDENNIIPITICKWIMKCSRSAGITGGMGTGKSTLLKALFGFTSSSKNTRVFEISPELNLQFTFPKRNIVNFSTTESISMQTLYDFGKKTNSNINIVAESASAEMGVIAIESATVGSEQALFTQHAKTASDLILSLRDNLTTAGGYNSERVAEEVVAKCINFDIHMGRERGHRFVERITEIIPIQDRAYPCDKTGTFSEKDTAEYYKRVTDRSSYTTRDIVRYVNGHYEMVNEISPEMMLRMRNSLTSEDEEIFNKDMQILEDFMSHKVC